MPPPLSRRLGSKLSHMSLFQIRWDAFAPDFEPSLRRLYGDQADETLTRLRSVLERATMNRPADLREQDERRLLSPDWLQRPEMVGYVTYVDRFAGTLAGVAEHLDYLRELGITYLHLMPLLKPRPGESDGGYAVADYREVRPDLGTLGDLTKLSQQLRANKIALEIDLVLNHVAAEHPWAAAARAGDPKYRDYFWIFPDRELPDAYEQTLPEVFPDFAPGSFSWDDEANGWVWTTFNTFQWDLNWSNPDVFLEFVELMCFLANAGIEVFRLDAIAFTWKRMGTDSQNQPEVHDLTRALRAAVRVAAPAVAFKAEAIVGPNHLINYLGSGEHHGRVSEMAYHNSLMVQLWSALASRDTGLLRTAMNAFPAKPTTATWATYVRCHDDIGWAIDDTDAWRAGLNGQAHRGFLSDFYSGEFPNSFAKGLVFQANPATGDRRISGTGASLAGLEAALATRDRHAINLAISRFLLLHAVMFGFGGLPLLYMGDELGLLNDYDYGADPAHAMDNRWAHRPKMPWDLVAQLPEHPDWPAARINEGIRHLIQARKRTPQLHASIESVVLESDPQLLVLLRRHPTATMVQVYNFTEHQVTISGALLREHLGASATEALSGYNYNLSPAEIALAPYQPLWLVAS